MNTTSWPTIRQKILAKRNSSWPVTFPCASFHEIPKLKHSCWVLVKRHGERANIRSLTTSPKQSSQKLWKKWRLGLLVWSAPSGSEFGFMICGFFICVCCLELFLMIFYSNIPWKTVCFSSFVLHKRDLRRGCLLESNMEELDVVLLKIDIVDFAKKHLRLLHFKEDFYRRNTTDTMQEKKEKHSL